MMSLTSLLVPSFRNMLGGLSAWLAKPAACGSGDALLVARLAPDMFPLGTQVRFACIQVQEAVSRLTDQAFPPIVATLRDEALAAAERPGSIAEAQGRIAETIAMLDGLAPDALDGGDPARPLAHRLPIGMILDMTAETYARDWALPQFQFHVMTAYAILRSTGLPLGKADYVAHLLPLVRPGTMPAG